MKTSIGNCDTCDYVLKCTHAGMGKKLFGGCPENLLEEHRKDNQRSIAELLCFYKYPEAKPNASGNYVMEFTEKLATAQVQYLEDYLLSELYETYKDSDLTKLFVIGRDEFYEFVKRCYPLWKEGMI